MRRLPRERVRELLQRAKWNQAEASRLAGLSERGFRTIVRAVGLQESARAMARERRASDRAEMRHEVLKTLRLARGDYGEAARLAGVRHQTFYRRVARLGLSGQAQQMREHYQRMDILRALLERGGDREVAAGDVGLANRAQLGKTARRLGMGAAVNRFARGVRGIDPMSEKARHLRLYLQVGGVISEAARMEKAKEWKLGKAFKKSGALALVREVEGLMGMNTGSKRTLLDL